MLTGLDIEAKAELVKSQLESTSPRSGPPSCSGRWPAPIIADADTEEAASALLHCVVRDPDPTDGRRVQFSAAAVELALASYPGFTSTAPPGDGQVYGVFTPGYVDAAATSATWQYTPTAPAWTSPRAPRRWSSNRSKQHRRRHRLRPAQPCGYRWAASPVPAAGTRADRRTSGCGSDAMTSTPWLAHTLTVDKLRELLPETAGLPVTRHLLPNLRAVNFVIDEHPRARRGLSGPVRPAGQGLGEWLRSRHIDIPERLL